MFLQVTQCARERLLDEAAIWAGESPHAPAVQAERKIGVHGFVSGDSGEINTELTGTHAMRGPCKEERAPRLQDAPLLGIVDEKRNERHGFERTARRRATSGSKPAPPAGGDLRVRAFLAYSERCGC